MNKFKKKSRTLFRIAKNTFKTLKEKGVSETIVMLKDVSTKINGFKDAKPHQDLLDCIEYIKEHLATEEEIIRQKNISFNQSICFSIIVPLYNTPKKFLREMIESVLNQSYSNWELCLADGSDDKHKFVEEIVMEYANIDKRILYKKLDENMGISGNTNACLEMAQGDYIVLFDHDDLLHSYALFKCMEVIEKEQADFIYSDEMVFEDEIANVKTIHFKPDFSPDTLRSHNYICHLCCFSKPLYNQVGGFSLDHNGSQDYDMVLRLTEKANKIKHISEVLYYWRSHPGSVASDINVKPYCRDSAIKAIDDHLKRIGLNGKAKDSFVPSTYKVEYGIRDDKLVSIIIPNKDHIDVLDKCLKSLYKKTTYSNFEIIIVENNSENKDTFEYYERVKTQYANLKVVVWDGPWNYSAINNFGVKHASGDYYLLLNNDVEVITPSWLEEMVMFIQRDDVGAVGSMLYYPDDTIQHAGLILGINGSAGHSHKHAVRDSIGYVHRLCIAQNLSGVTGACLMTKRSIWDEIQGLDESFAVSFNDVDFCLRIRQAGYLIVFTPYAELYHYESKSRGLDESPEKKERMEKEAKHLRDRWPESIQVGGDPYYNKNLTHKTEGFTIK